MLRFFILWLNLFVVLFFKNFFGDPVTVNVDVQSAVVAGNDVKVTVTLSKGALESFSRFQLELPAGVTASADNSAYSDFSFQDKKLRFIWLRLPAQNEITFSYFLHFDERIKGTLNLGGRFSYIENNERKYVDVVPQLITINPSPSVDPNLIVDIADFEKTYIQNLGGNESLKVACIRQKPDLSNSDNEIIVHLLVCKQEATRYGKIEEQIPPGYVALNINSRDGIFSFKDGIAKFIWMNLPSENYFVVSYKLVPEKAVKTDNLNIVGVFSFFQNERNLNVNVNEMGVKVTDMTMADIRKLVKQTKTTVPIIVAKSDTTKKVTKKIVKILPEETSDLLEPDTGVYYRVQLAAGHRRINVKRYFKRFKLDSLVKTEVHEGWRKYSVGKFGIYKDARDYRVHIWNTTTISDAFVSAYNNGKRITVQEALMIANQKWYR